MGGKGSRNSEHTLQNKFKVLYTNADSLINKMDELQVAVGEHNPEIIMICEVIPKSGNLKVTHELIKVEGYDVFTNIDKENNHRGIVIYISMKLKAQEVSFDSDFTENTWCTVLLTGRDELLVGYIYRSPSSMMENNKLLCELMQLVSKSRVKHVLIMGDFKFPDINWKRAHVDSTSNNPSHMFLTATQESFFHQHIDEPTRHRHGQRANVLDLVFTNTAELILSIEYLPPLGLSDHVCLLAEFDILQETDKKERKPYNLSERRLQNYERNPGDDRLGKGFCR